MSVLLLVVLPLLLLLRCKFVRVRSAVRSLALLFYVKTRHA